MAEAAPNLTGSPLGSAGEDLSVSMPESWRVRPIAVPPATPATPAQRIALIEDSQRCLTHGWLSLVPLVGVPFIVSAFRWFRRVDRERAEWNPAAHLWLRGLVLASLGYWSNLFWWGLLARWLGEATNVMRSDGSALVQFFCVLVFGTAPGFLGLGLAATRWPNCFGTFVKRRHRELFTLLLLGLVLASYATSVHLAASHGMGGNQKRLPSDLLLTGASFLWPAWLLAGFACLARRSTNLWWWVGWLLGGALLGGWAAAN